jgi:hypothetical protein
MAGQVALGAPPKQSRGLWDEMLRQTALSLVRHALTALGAALAGLGWVAPDKFDSWAAAHSAELVGWLLIMLAQAWSWMQKRDALNLVRVAIRMPSQQQNGIPTTVEHVRQKDQHIRAGRRALLPLCALLALPCDAQTPQMPSPAVKRSLVTWGGWFVGAQRYVPVRRPFGLFTRGQFAITTMVLVGVGERGSFELQFFAPLDGRGVEYKTGFSYRIF